MEAFMEKTRTGYFAEMVDLSEAQIDSEARRVRVTLIKPGWSANSRYYSREVLSKAVSMFEGTKAYFDHPSKEDQKNRPERSVRDLAGWYEGVKQEPDGRITADLNVDHPDAWRIIETAVTRKPDYAGLSINALGSTRKGEAEGRAGVLVEDIAKANSTDIVTTPAAGGKFERLLMADDDGFTRDLLEAMPLDELKETLREVRPDFFDSLKREMKTTRDSEAIQEARATADDKSAQLAALTEENRTTKDALAEALEKIVALNKQAAVDRLLSEAKLPIEVRKELREKLIEAESAEAMQNVIDTALATLAAVRLPVHVHGAGRTASPTVVTEARPAHNPIAGALGISEAAAEAETFDAFLEARKQK
jgi:hypothetical protein